MIEIYLLGLFVAGNLGAFGVVVAAFVTALCAAVAWTSRRRAERSQH